MALSVCDFHDSLVCELCERSESHDNVNSVRCCVEKYSLIRSNICEKHLISTQLGCRTLVVHIATPLTDAPSLTAAIRLWGYISYIIDRMLITSRAN